MKFIAPGLYIENSTISMINSFEVKFYVKTHQFLILWISTFVKFIDKHVQYQLVKVQWELARIWNEMTILLYWCEFNST